MSVDEGILLNLVIFINVEDPEVSHSHATGKY